MDIMKSIGYSGGSVQFSEFVFKGIWEFGPLLHKQKPGSQEQCLGSWTVKQQTEKDDTFKSDP
jgi:hypothetical protein